MKTTQNTSQPQKADHLIMLDLVRFLAAVLVMGLHLGFWGWWRAGDALGTIAEMFPNYPELPEGTSLFWFGWVGVQIFFVISGLVITMSAENSSPLSFLRSRFLRIYPAAWVCATLSLLIVGYAASGFDQGIIGRYLNSLLLSPYPRWIDGVYWTLALELVFYGIIFLLLVAGYKQQLPLLGIVLGSASSLYVAGLAAGIAPTGWFFTLLLLRHGTFFAIGMLIWLIGRGKAPRIYYVFVILFTSAGIMEIRHAAGEKLDALNFAAPLWPPVAVWLAASVIIFASVSHAQASNRLLRRSKSLLRVLGLATYPLYLTHQTIGGFAGSLAMSAGISRQFAFLIAVTSATAAGVLIALKLEPALRRLVAPKFDYLAAVCARAGNRAKYG